MNPQFLNLWNTVCHTGPSFHHPPKDQSYWKLSYKDLPWAANHSKTRDDGDHCWEMVQKYMESSCLLHSHRGNHQEKVRRLQVHGVLKLLLVHEKKCMEVTIQEKLSGGCSRAASCISLLLFSSPPCMVTIELWYEAEGSSCLTVLSNLAQNFLLSV